MNGWVITAVSDAPELDAPDWFDGPPGLDADADCWLEGVPCPEATLSPVDESPAPEADADETTLEAWGAPGGIDPAVVPGVFAPGVLEMALIDPWVPNTDGWLEEVPSPEAALS